jgi:hypothetical protein
MADQTPKKPRKKRKPRAKAAPPVQRDPFVLLLYLVSGVLGFAMLAIVALVWFEKLPEQSRTTALGGMTGLATAAATTAGIAANRSSIAAANAKQTQQIEQKTDQQTNELKGHSSGLFGSVKGAYSEWKDWQMGGGNGNVSGNGGATSDDAAANREAKKAWIQAHKQGGQSG